MKKHIPNLITLLNLVAGTIAVYLVLQGNYFLAIFFIAASLVFDFFDGFAARIFRAGSELGKQLDSLSDLVSFGLVTAAMILMIFAQVQNLTAQDDQIRITWLQTILTGSVVIVPVFAALRLAKFNLQKKEGLFFGLPVPAFALFWLGIYYDIMSNGSLFQKVLPFWFYWVLMVVSAFFMILPVPMIALKFKSFQLKENFSRYILVIISVILLLVAGIPGLTIAILTYILISLIAIILT